MHILHSGPLCSIRHAMLSWLIPVFLVVGVASAAISYWSFGQMANEFMDAQMSQLGDAVAAQPQPVILPIESLDRIHRHGVYITQVFDAQGRVLQTSWPLNAHVLGSPGFQDLRLDDTGWRTYVTPPRTADGHRVMVLQSVHFRKTLAAARAGGTITPVMILMVLATLTLWVVANAISRDVQAIGRAAMKQDEHTITELPLAAVPREIVPLVESFNSLLARLREAFAAQRRFMQDAAHELRTPITALALQLENLRRDMPAGTCSDSLRQLQAGVGRSQRMVDQLLKVARREATGPEARVDVDLQSQVRESIGALIALADQHQVDLGVTGDPPAPPLALTCAKGDLRSVLDNLIENAVRYTPRGGTVDVRLAREHGRACIEVIDTGPGIPADQIDRVFDRFYRVPGTELTGSGLGLAIAKGAAQRCGLRITLRNRDDRSGLIARIEPA
jgi:two-component system OmpR family sensor kinase